MKRPPWPCDDLNLRDEWGKYVDRSPPTGYPVPPYGWHTILLVETSRVAVGEWTLIDVAGTQVAISLESRSYGSPDEWYAETEYFYQYGLSALDAVLGALGKSLEIVGERIEN